jgi:hypothetical protein
VLLHLLQLGPVRRELDALERERDALRRTADTVPAEEPDLPADFAGRYRQEVHALIETFEDAACPDTLDAARRLIDKVIVNPAVGLAPCCSSPWPVTPTGKTTAVATPLVTSLASLANREPRAKPLPGPGQCPGLATSNSAP